MREVALCDTTDFLCDPIPSKIKAGIADLNMILVLVFLAMFNGVRKIKIKLVRVIATK